MSEALAIAAVVVLFGIVTVRPVFGMTSDEAGLVVGGVLAVLAVTAWAVERFTDRKAS